MAGTFTKLHPLWETVHALKIRFQEALEPEKLFVKVSMSFVTDALSWWVPFSRVRKVPKAKLISGNACDYLSTLKQVTSPL